MVYVSVKMKKINGKNNTKHKQLALTWLKAKQMLIFKFHFNVCTNYK